MSICRHKNFCWWFRYLRVISRSLCVFLVSLIFSGSAMAETWADYDSHRARGGDTIQPHTAAPCIDDAAFLLPALFGMTSFIRIIIVLSLLRQALGTMQTLPNRVLLGIAFISHTS